MKKSRKSTPEKPPGDGNSLGRTTTISKATSSYEVSLFRLEDSQILNCSKESKDRLLMLHDTIKKNIDKNFSQMSDGRDEYERLRCKEVIMMLKMLMGRLQLGIYDSHLLIELCQYLQGYDLALAKCREEARKLLLENVRLRDQIETLSEQAYAKEAQLASSHEMLCYWEFLAETAAMEFNCNGEDLTLHELFKGSLKLTEGDVFESLYDIKEPERSLYQEIRHLIANNKISEAIAFMRNYLKPDQFARTEQLSNVLLSLSTYCMDAELFDDARDACYNAMSILTSLYNRSDWRVVSVGCRVTFSYITEQVWSMAVSAMLRAAEDFRTNSMNEETSIIARMYFVIGYCYWKGTHEPLGLQIMEMVILALESKLPFFEEDWSALCVSYAKVLNSLRFFSAALYITCDAMQYWVENLNSFKMHHKRAKSMPTINKPVFEVAFEQDESQVLCAEGDVPTGESMSCTYQEILGEMKVAFAGVGRIAANTLLDRYIDEVKRLDADLNITEEEMKLEISRIMDKSQRQVRESLFDGMAFREPKKPLKCSDALMEFMKMHDNEKCPLEYKTATKRSKKPPQPFKTLVGQMKLLNPMITKPSANMLDDKKKKKKDKK